MRQILRRWVLPLAMLLAIGSSLPAAADPAPAFSAKTGLLNYTNQIAWAHQCAAAHCGYHVIPSGAPVIGMCYSINEGVRWNLVIAASPWNSNVPIAGYVDRIALNGAETSVPCSSAGEGPHYLNQETWAHSCPSINCGYGVMTPNHDVAGLCRTSGYEGYLWDLVLDHNNANKDLVGFIHNVDLPGADPADVC
jgi:hypothetical protein